MKNFYSLFGFALLAVACGGPLKYQVPSSAKAPGADAKVVADVAEDQGQTRVEIEVTNLAPPERVNPNAKVFVAWYRKGPSAIWSRIGGLKYDEGDREGSLAGSVPEIAFDLTISAEATEAPASPSADVVLSQRVQE
jgi:hypothetical protein